MKLTEINKTKAGKYALYLDGAFYCSVSGETLLGQGLAKGDELSEDRLSQIVYAEERRNARERAYRLLGIRDYAEEELARKLAADYPEEIVAEIMAMLVSQGFINDEAYADKLAEHYLKTKGFSRKKAFFSMLQRGVSGELAGEALDRCEVDPVAQIKRILAKKYHGCPGEEDQQRVLASLCRQGFSYGDIKRAMDTYDEE